MTIRKLALIASVATLVGAASPVLADDSNSGMTGPNDDTGLSSLGVDISRVGGGAAAVGDFLAGLSPDAQRGVIGGCRTAVNSGGSGYSPAVVGFCRTALNLEPMPGSALGYMAQPNRAYVPSPIIENRNVIPEQTVPSGDVAPSPYETPSNSN